MTVIALTLVAYLLGSVPTSLLIARYLKGIDLREWGSGNLGATNLYRAAGAPVASLAVIVDVSKGFVPTWLFPTIDGLGTPALALLYGAVAMLGHIFPVWVGFRGGKGVATGGGVFLAMAPLAVAVAAGLWLAAVAMTRIVSIGSLLAATSLPPLVWFTGHGGDFVFWATIPVAILVWWTHRANIGRLLAGKELPARRGVGAPTDRTAAGPHGSAGTD